MTLSDQLHGIRSRIDAARQSRRLASAVGRRIEAQQWDLHLNDLECEEARFIERISELEEEM